MTALNNINLQGKIISIPSLTYSSYGVPVVSFSLASHSGTKVKGTQVDNISLFSVAIHGTLAEAIEPYLKDGRRITISGNSRNADNNKYKLVIESALEFNIAGYCLSIRRN